MAAGEAALVTGAITVGLAGAVGYWLYKTITIKGKATKASDYGQMWLAWMVFIGTLSTLPRFFIHFDVDSFITWVIVVVFTGAVAFVAGLLYGKVFGGKSRVAQALSMAYRGQSTNDTKCPDPATIADSQHALVHPSSPIPDKSASDSHIQVTIDEDRIYGQIAEEFEIGTTEKGLWTRLFAECEGDEKRVKVLYIKQRADRLITAERVRLEQTTRELATESERLKILQGQTTCEQAAEPERLHTFQRKLDGLADPELVSAVWNGNWSVVSMILKDGEEPFGRDQNGNSLLDIARKQQDPQMIQLLESYGAP